VSKTSIEWTRGDDGTAGATWNPVRGCRKISPGCKHCYAETFAERFEGVAGHPYELGFKPRTVPDALDAPLRWKRPRRVFVNSMSDLFLEDFSNEYIAAVFGVMAAAPQHTFQVLTKRAKRMREWFEWVASNAASRCSEAAVWATTVDEMFPEQLSDVPAPWPLPNVWTGVSCEDQPRLIERVEDLRHIPAAVRFMSLEPLLGPLDFEVDPDATSRRLGVLTCPVCRGWGGSLTSLVPDVNGNEQMKDCTHCRSSGCAIDWAIIGGESGPGARPFDAVWARSIVAQCRLGAVACFVKQFGSHPIDGRISSDVIRMKDRKGGDPSEWPPGDWPREFPLADNHVLANAARLPEYSP
jgi:protein gp37